MRLHEYLSAGNDAEAFNVKHSVEGKLIQWADVHESCFRAHIEVIGGELSNSTDFPHGKVKTMIFSKIGEVAG